VSPAQPRSGRRRWQVVESLPTEIADVVTGGSWSADKQGDFYRAIVAMTGAEKDFGAHVFLQWVALSETNPVPKVIATVSVKEVTTPSSPMLRSRSRRREQGQ
jgi:hypothetical protein